MTRGVKEDPMCLAQCWLHMGSFSAELNAEGHMWKRGKGPVDSDSGCPLNEWVHGAKYRKFHSWGGGWNFRLWEVQSKPIARMRSQEPRGQEGRKSQRVLGSHEQSRKVRRAKEGDCEVGRKNTDILSQHSLSRVAHRLFCYVSNGPIARSDYSNFTGKRIGIIGVK